MKKLILLLTLLTIGVFGQNQDKSPNAMTSREYDYGAFNYTAEAYRIIDVTAQQGVSFDTVYTIGTTATNLSTLAGVDYSLFSISIVNATSGATVYVGGIGTNTSTVGWMLNYQDIFVDATGFYKKYSKVYVVSSTASTNIKIKAVRLK